MRERVRVECAWLLALAAGPAAAALASLPASARDWARRCAQDPSATDVLAIKHIEARTKHDVKAVEYWIRGELEARGATAAQLEWVHFAATSEDINNLAYALMLKRARDSLLVPQARGARRGDRLARAAPRRCRHARAHARTGRDAHHRRQGARERRRAPRAAAQGHRAAWRCSAR